MRRTRPEPLTPAERAFDLGQWLTANATLISARGIEWLIQCPVCGGDKLAVNVQRKAWQCWRGSCGFKGWSLYVLVAAIAGVGLFAALELIQAGAVHSDLAVGPLSERIEAVDLFRMLPAAPLPPGTRRGLAPTQHEYALARGIPDAHAEAFGIGTVLGDGSGSKGDWLLRGRLLFPVWMGMRVVFWSARAVGAHHIKTLHLPAACSTTGHPPGCACVHRDWGLAPVADCATGAEALMGLHLACHGDRVILVEGPVDAAVVGVGAVCVFGCRVHPAQVAALVARGVSEVVVAFDGDDAGRRGAANAVQQLAPFLPTRVAHLPPGTDPGALGRDRVLRLVDRANRPDGVAPLRPSLYDDEDSTYQRRFNHPVAALTPD